MHNKTINGFPIYHMGNLKLASLVKPGLLSPSLYEKMINMDLDAEKNRPITDAINDSSGDKNASALAVKTAVAEAKSYADDIKAQLLGGADGAYNTLLDIQQQIEESGDNMDLLLNAVDSKLGKSGGVMTGPLNIDDDSLSIDPVNQAANGGQFNLISASGGLTFFVTDSPERYGILQVGNSDDGYPLDVQQGKLKLNPYGGEVTINNYKVWTENNMGVDSGLDAGLFGGELPDYYAKSSQLGTLTDINVEDTTSLQTIINEVITNIGDLSTLNTDDKSTITNSINELDSELGDVSNLKTDAKVGVDSINEIYDSINSPSKSDPVINTGYNYKPGVGLTEDISASIQDGSFMDTTYKGLTLINLWDDPFLEKSQAVVHGTYSKNGNIGTITGNGDEDYVYIKKTISPHELESGDDLEMFGKIKINSLECIKFQFYAIAKDVNGPNLAMCEEMDNPPGNIWMKINGINTMDPYDKSTLESIRLILIMRFADTVDATGATMDIDLDYGIGVYNRTKCGVPDNVILSDILPRATKGLQYTNPQLMVSNNKNLSPIKNGNLAVWNSDIINLEDGYFVKDNDTSKDEGVMVNLEAGQYTFRVKAFTDGSTGGKKVVLGKVDCDNELLGTYPITVTQTESAQNVTSFTLEKDETLVLYTIADGGKLSFKDIEIYRIDDVETNYLEPKRRKRFINKTLASSPSGVADIIHPDGLVERYLSKEITLDNTLNWVSYADTQGADGDLSVVQLIDFATNRNLAQGKMKSGLGYDGTNQYNVYDSIANAKGYSVTVENGNLNLLVPTVNLSASTIDAVLTYLGNNPVKIKLELDKAENESTGLKPLPVYSGGQVLLKNNASKIEMLGTDGVIFDYNVKRVIQISKITTEGEKFLDKTQSIVSNNNVNHPALDSGDLVYVEVEYTNGTFIPFITESIFAFNIKTQVQNNTSQLVQYSGMENKVNKIINDKITGTANFSGDTGTVINHGMGRKPSAVMITPIGDSEGYLGEYYFTQDVDNITVYNTGTSTKEFSYIIFK